MQKVLTVSQARARFGRLTEQAAKGKPVYLRRGDSLLRLARVRKERSIPVRPFGYFKFDDELTALADRAQPAFTPVDEN